MAMNMGGGRGSRRAPMAEINVTPLVDVMLVLLIIFMITAPLLVSGVPVDLPDSRAGALLSAEVAITSATSVDDRRSLGLRFLGNNCDRYRIIADIAYGDLSAMRALRASRQNRQGLLVGTARTLIWAAREALRGLFFFLFRRNVRANATGQQAVLPTLGIRSPEALPQTGLASEPAPAVVRPAVAPPASGRSARLPDVGLADFAPGTRA